MITHRFQSLVKWWLSLNDGERREHSILFGVLIVYVIHYLVFCIPQPFFIEDAAISFAYARNAAMGEGFVTYPGGEPVEGFSNALWTFLITIWYAVGVPVWTSAKVMGAIFGVVTLPYVYGLTKKMGVPSMAALISPAMLALSPQFAIWNASGLENSLYVMCLAGGMWHLIEESEHPHKKPISALFFCGLAMTRPEGVMYVAVAALTRFILAVVDRRLRAFVVWVLAFSIPFGLFYAWRMWYFAWPFPNTYYAKLGAGKAFKPFSWTIKGWKYIHAYLDKHYLVYALPLLGVALVGTRGWRIKAYCVMIAQLTLMILWDGKWPDGPEWWSDVSTKWVELRVYSILTVAVLVGLMNLGRPGWRARSLLWATGASSVFFVVYSGGDWMKAHRWFNVVEVPLIPILFAGLWAIVERVPTHWNSKPLRIPIPRSAGIPVWSLVLALPLVGYGAAEINVSYGFSRSPETSVNDVHRRVKYMTWVQNRLDLDHVTLLDVDMGAHVYFSGWDIVDIAGLVDVPIARHSDYNHKFMSEYIFKERKPEFAHVHGGWARTSRIPKHKEWDREYLEIPGYPVGGRRLHIGNHIRRDIFIHTFTRAQADAAIAAADPILFEDGVTLVDYSVPSPEVSSGGWLYIKTAWRIVKERENNVQAIFLLESEDGTISSSASLMPGYRWYPMSDWKTSEQIDGKFKIVVPEDLKQGQYKLKLLLIDTITGDILHSVSDSDEATQEIYTDLNINVEVGNPDSAMAEAEIDRENSIALAEEGQCLDAWETWKNATRHVGRNKGYSRKHTASIRNGVAQCFLDKAKVTQEEPEILDHLEAAFFWDNRLDGLAEVADLIAQDWVVKGDEMMAEEDWKGAYDAYSQALVLDPSLSWVRRAAEDARDKRLRIVRPYQKKPPKAVKDKKEPARTPIKKLDKKITPKVIP